MISQTLDGIENSLDKIIEDLKIDQIINKDSILSKEYFYHSLPQCVVDSIFSIGVRYSSTKNTVNNFSNYFEIPVYRKRNSKYILKQEQLSINNTIKVLSNFTHEETSKDIYKNFQRTSTKSGHLKSSVVFKFFKILKKFGINFYQDLDKLNNGEVFESFKNDIISLRGQSSGISFDYFLMLSGNNDFIKVDRMVRRFLVNNKIIGLNDKISDVKKCFKLLLNEINNKISVKLNSRELDHLIWKYQSSK